jgi:hypothetical protein
MIGSTTVRPTAETLVQKIGTEYNVTTQENVLAGLMDGSWASAGSSNVTIVSGALRMGKGTMIVQFIDKVQSTWSGLVLLLVTTMSVMIITGW